ncbi:MAG: DUF5058 family protein [Synergistaceae bacterium]
MSEILAVANLPIVWLLCGVTVVVSLIQALLYTRMAKKTAVEAGIPESVTKVAFKVGLVSAVGPAIGVFIVMVGLMSAIGSPMAWQRLSIIGAAATELTAATIGATASGVTLGGEGYTLTVLAVSWFTMALNGAGWLVFTGLFTPSLEKLREKASGGDIKWLAALSGAASLGIFGYLNQSQIRASMGHALASIMGAISMVLIVRYVVPKCPKLVEYSLGIAMLIGMAFAVIYDVMAPGL